MMEMSMIKSPFKSILNTEGSLDPCPQYWFWVPKPVQKSYSKNH